MFLNIDASCIFHWNEAAIVLRFPSQISFDQFSYDHRFFDILSYLSEMFGKFKVFWFFVRFRGKATIPWVGIPNRESHGQTMRVGRYVGLMVKLWELEGMLLAFRVFQSADQMWHLWHHSKAWIVGETSLFLQEFAFFDWINMVWNFTDCLEILSKDLEDTNLKNHVEEFCFPKWIFNVICIGKILICKLDR